MSNDDNDDTFHSLLHIHWLPNELVVFRMEGKYNTHSRAWRVKCSIEVNKQEHFMAEFERQDIANFLDLLNFTSFIEDFHREQGANGCLYARQATFLQPVITYQERKETKQLVFNQID